jgi:hypothetical protein
MRRYDEPIEVRRGLVAGQEAPEQFIWRGRLWVVRDVVSHWVETGAWWEQDGVAALLGVGAERASGQRSSAPTSAGVSAIPFGADLLAESDLWRVEAWDGRRRRWSRRQAHDSIRQGGQAGQARPVGGDDDDPDADFDRGYGVFDLAFDWTQAQWRLLGCVD